MQRLLSQVQNEIQVLMQIVNAHQNWVLPVDTSEIETAIQALNLTDDEALNWLDIVDAQAMIAPFGFVQKATAMSAQEIADYIALGDFAPLDGLPEDRAELVTLLIRLNKYLALRAKQEPEMNGDAQAMMALSRDLLFLPLQTKLEMLRMKLDFQYNVDQNWQMQIMLKCQQVAPDTFWNLYQRVMEYTRGGWGEMTMSLNNQYKLTKNERLVVNWMREQHLGQEFADAGYSLIVLVTDFMKKFGANPASDLQMMGVNIDYIHAAEQYLQQDGIKKIVRDALVADLPELIPGRYSIAQIVELLADEFDYPSEPITLDDHLSQMTELRERLATMLPVTEDSDGHGLERVMVATKFGADNRASNVTIPLKDGKMMSVQFLPPFASQSDKIRIIWHEGAHNFHASVYGTKFTSFDSAQAEEWALAVEDSGSYILAKEDGKKLEQFKSALSVQYRQAIYGLIQAYVWKAAFDGLSFEDVYAGVQRLIQKYYLIDLGDYQIDLRGSQTWFGNVQLTDPTDGWVYCLGQILATVEVEGDHEDDDDDEETDVEPTKTVKQVLVEMFGKDWLVNADVVILMTKALQTGVTPISAEILRINSIPTVKQPVEDSSD